MRVKIPPFKHDKVN